MSLPKYREYVESGVPWLGAVPSHWHVHQAKRHFRRRKDLNAGMVCENRLALTMNGVVPRSLDDLDGLQSSDYEGYQIFESGDLAFKLIDLQNIKTSRVGLVPERGIMSPAYIRLEPSSTTHKRYAYWYFMALYWTQVFNSLGGGVRQTLGPEELLTVEYPVPPLSEQVVIAAFLDRETAKIDALIAEQEKLIALLAEKRQATISHAVIKGLNPNAPMKDSGAAWMGEVPAHWEVIRVKNVARLESGHTPSKQFPEYWENCDIPWVSLNDSKYLAVNDYISDTAVKINELGLSNSSARMLPSGTVVFTRDATIGLAAITTLPMAVSQHLIAWCPSERITSLFLLRVFNAMKPHLDVHTFGATIKTIGMADVKKLVTVVPPIEEQLKITAHIDAELAKLNALRGLAVRAITLLKERRSALIAAAVTGQIDLRGAISQTVGKSLEAIAA